MFTWLRDKRRRELVAQPFPERWLRALERDVRHYAALTPAEQEKLRDDLRIFLAEKSWEGCGGLTLNDEMKVVISAQACLLTLCIENDYYPNVESILVYPAGYVARERRAGPGGIVEVSRSARLGEAWAIGGPGGPVVLSWSDAFEGGRDPDDGHNVVFHEFAHKLDMRDGEANGVPPLADSAQYDRWAEVMSAEYAALVAAVARGEHTVLDRYGATNAGEFFAVATECFFERPRALRDQRPALYDVLRDFYRQDTAARDVAVTR